MVSIWYSRHRLSLFIVPHDEHGQIYLIVYRSAFDCWRRREEDRYTNQPRTIDIYILRRSTARRRLPA